jgi:hypothetical protein
MTHMLQPGIYSLIPVETDDEADGETVVALDPHTAYNLEDAPDSDASLVVVGDTTDPITPFDAVEGGLVLSIDIGDVDPDGSSVVGPWGALSIAQRYVLIPVDRWTANAEPDAQYAINWLSFELTATQPLTVEGSTIRIGQMEIDPTILGAVSLGTTLLDGVETDWAEIVGAGRAQDATHVYHVARNGDALNAILSAMPRSHDDGVLVMLDFTPAQVTEIEWIGTEAADAFAREMRSQMAQDRSHIVLHPAF